MVHHSPYCSCCQGSSQSLVQWRQREGEDSQWESGVGGERGLTYEVTAMAGFVLLEQQLQQGGVISPFSGSNRRSCAVCMAVAGWQGCFSCCPCGTQPSAWGSESATNAACDPWLLWSRAYYIFFFFILSFKNKVCIIFWSVCEKYCIPSTVSLATIDVFLKLFLFLPDLPTMMVILSQLSKLIWHNKTTRGGERIIDATHSIPFPS